MEQGAGRSSQDCLRRRAEEEGGDDASAEGLRLGVRDLHDTQGEGRGASETERGGLGLAEVGDWPRSAEIGRDRPGSSLRCTDPVAARRVLPAGDAGKDGTDEDGGDGMAVRGNVVPFGCSRVEVLKPTGAR